MTQETKDNLKKYFSGKNTATSLLVAFLIWTANFAFSTVVEIKNKFNSDHNNVMMVVPAVRQLQKTDSSTQSKINTQNGNIELIKASQADMKENVNELKQLMYQLIRQTK